MPSRSKLSLCAPALAIFGGGCSLLYNPSNLPTPSMEAGVDMATDMEIILDTNPAALSVDSVFPPTIAEGAGDGGSPPALLVVNGMQFVQGADTMVTIAPHDTTSDISKITVDNTKLKVALDGRQLVVPITVGVDTTKASGTLALDVTVTQTNGMGGHVAQTVPGDAALTIQFYDELTDGNIPSGNKLATGVHEYAKVDITAGGVKPADTNGPLVIRSHSSLSIVGGVDVSASGTTAGPGGAGGGNGGPGGVGTSNPGGMGGGAGGGKPSSAGGGLGTVGGDGNAPSTGGGPVGNPSLPLLGGPQQGAGGSGGTGSALLGVGGVGGAGGGTVELTAAGTLSVDSVTSTGGLGTSTNTKGGSGSGGVILLRGGKSVAATTLNISGAASPGAGVGKGGDGLLRVDQPALADVTVTAQYHGPMFMTYPQITDVETPMVTVVGTKMAGFSYYYIDDQGAIEGPFQKTLGVGGSVVFALQPLMRGISHVCLLVDGGGTTPPAEAANCADIAYMYKP